MSWLDFLMIMVLRRNNPPFALRQAQEAQGLEVGLQIYERLSSSKTG